MSAVATARRKNPPFISLAAAEPDWVFQLESTNGGFSDAEFEQFCLENPDLRIEMSKEGKMIIMMPMFPRGGNKEFELVRQPCPAWRTRQAAAQLSCKHEVTHYPVHLGIRPRRLRRPRKCTASSRRKKYDDREPAREGGKEGGKQYDRHQSTPCCHYRGKENHDHNDNQVTNQTTTPL